MRTPLSLYIETSVCITFLRVLLLSNNGEFVSQLWAVGRRCLCWFVQLTVYRECEVQRLNEIQIRATMNEWILNFFLLSSITSSSITPQHIKLQSKVKYRRINIIVIIPKRSHPCFSISVSIPTSSVLVKQLNYPLSMLFLIFTYFPTFGSSSPIVTKLTTF